MSRLLYAARGAPFAWSRKFGVSRGGPLIQSGMIDTEGAKEVFATQIPEQIHQRE